MQRVLIVEVYTPPVGGVSEGRYAIERHEGGRGGGPWPKENVRVLGVEGDYCRWTEGCDAKATHVVTYVEPVLEGARMETLACGPHVERWKALPDRQAEAHAFRE